jgi:hypothetical protein
MSTNRADWQARMAFWRCVQNCNIRAASEHGKSKNDPETEPFFDWVANFLFTLDTAVYRWAVFSHKTLLL